MKSHTPNQTLLLAIDNVSLPLRRNLTLHITKPHVHAEPVLRPQRGDTTKPDHLAALFYGSVLHVDSKFRMWYSPVGEGPDPAIPEDQLDSVPYLDAALTRGPVCYAESEDGIHWERPNLGQFSYRGNKEHNGLDMGFDTIAGAAIIRDERDPDPARRYKAIFSYYVYVGETCATLGGATSPDGIHWTPGPLDPLKHEFFEATGFHRHGDMYVAIGQKGGDYDSENATPSSRQGRAHVSYDFDSWTGAQGEALLLPEPRDPALRSTYGEYDQVHVGIGTANYHNVTVGLFGLWHNGPDFRNVTCDLGLAISNDGLHFRQVVQGMPYIHHQDSPIHDFNTALPQRILTQGNGILNVGDRTLIYHGRWTSGGLIGGPCEKTGSYELHTEHFDEYYSEIALAEIERDRWGSLGLFPDANEGHVWTAPLRLPEDMSNFQLSLNATGAAGLKVSIAQENLQPIDSFSGGQCLGGDGLDSIVSWPGDLAELAGQSVRFRVDFTREGDLEPRLFAMNVDGL